MSKIRILLIALALAAIVGSALVFSPLRRFLPIDIAGVMAARIAGLQSPLGNDKTAPVAAGTAAMPAAPRAPGNDDKPAALVKSLAAALSPPPTDRDDHGPAFDVVRVDPSGQAVIAGRAAPGAVVELLRDGKPLDRTVADKSGNFVMTPSQLPAGSYGLKLRSAKPDGQQDISKETVAVAVQPSRREQPVVTRHAPDRERIALSKPAAPRPVGAAVAVDKVEAAPGGKLSVEGRGTPGATIRFYLNDSLLASSKAGAEGSLKFVVDGGVRPGEYRIRLEEVDPVSSAVRSRAEASVTVTRTVAAAGSVSTQADAPAQLAGTSRSASQDSNRAQPGAAAPGPEAQAFAVASAAGAPSAVVVPAIKTAVVARGDSLWRISEETYGNGTQYPVIYHANQQHIRNPNLIYPGQIFVLPEQTQAEGQKGR